MLTTPRIAGYGLRLATALAASVFAGRLWYLLLSNQYLPLFLPRILALPLAVLLALASAYGEDYLGQRLQRWSRPAFWALLAVSLLLCWVLYPVGCDTSESFVDTPNRRCDCAGFSFWWYPRGVFDGSAIEYCIGLERPVR